MILQGSPIEWAQGCENVQAEVVRRVILSKPGVHATPSTVKRTWALDRLRCHISWALRRHNQFFIFRHSLLTSSDPQGKDHCVNVEVIWGVCLRTVSFLGKAVRERIHDSCYCASVQWTVLFFLLKSNRACIKRVYPLLYPWKRRGQKVLCRHRYPTPETGNFRSSHFLQRCNFTSFIISSYYHNSLRLP